MSDMLIIDDDPVFSEVLAGALKRRGYKATTADSAQRAVAEMREGDISRVVLDLRLATENGLELIPTLCAMAPGVRIVVLTGYASIATAVEAIKLGAHHYLTKPTDLPALLAAFEHEPGAIPLEPASQPASLERIEWETIQKALLEAEGNVSAAAARLGLHRRTLQRKLKKRPAGLR
jgi:two-component system response regulator RegA